MSSCSTNYNRFVITKGVDNTFIFTVKADGTTLPMTITAGDTFTAYLKLIEDGSVALTKQLTPLGDLASGKVELVISAVEANTLISAKGKKEDRWYIKPNYTLVIECKTANNGDFIAKVPEIYVD